jgi:VanZ family protein
MKSAKLITALVFVAYTCLLLWLSSAAPKSLPSIGLFSEDKIGHFLAYATYAGLAYWVLVQYPLGLSLGNIVAVSVCYSALFGFVMEYMQYYCFTGRTFDVYDMLANSLGACLFAISRKVFLALQSQGNTT